MEYLFILKEKNYYKIHLTFTKKLYYSKISFLNLHSYILTLKLEFSYIFETGKKVHSPLVYHNRNRDTQTRSQTKYKATLIPLKPENHTERTALESLATRKPETKHPRVLLAVKATTCEQRTTRQGVATAGFKPSTI